MQVVNGNGGVIKAVATGERTYGMCLDTDTLSAMNDGSPLALSLIHIFIIPQWSLWMGRTGLCEFLLMKSMVC